MQNAARFTKQGFVCVRCTVQQATGGGLTAKFAVLDSGSGISEAAKATLFNLYNSVGGIGLGMFLSGKLLSLLGSKIEVESPWRSEGPGAAFYFNIKMAAAAPSSTKAANPVPAGAALPPPTPSSAATSCAACSNVAVVAGAAEASSPTFAWWSRGTTNTCTGACGAMSRKATTSSLDSTMSAGISSATIEQNRQSAITSFFHGDHGATSALSEPTGRSTQLSPRWTCAGPTDLVARDGPPHP